jgi:hypothetical protein
MNPLLLVMEPRTGDNVCIYIYTHTHTHTYIYIYIYSIDAFHSHKYNCILYTFLNLKCHVENMRFVAVGSCVFIQLEGKCLTAPKWGDRPKYVFRFLLLYILMDKKCDAFS